MITPPPLPRPLTSEEQRLLFLYCREHPIARCRGCQSEYAMSQLGSDLFGTRFNLCRSCRVPLTDSIREHLASCMLLGDERYAGADCLGERVRAERNAAANRGRSGAADPSLV